MSYRFSLRFAMPVWCRAVTGRNAPHSYSLRPVARGEYHFGTLNVYAQRRLVWSNGAFCFETNGAMVPAYPSFIQMRKYELMAISNRLTEAGIKKCAGSDTQWSSTRFANTFAAMITAPSIGKPLPANGRWWSTTIRMNGRNRWYSVIDMGGWWMRSTNCRCWIMPSTPVWWFPILHCWNRIAPASSHFLIKLAAFYRQNARPTNAQSDGNAFTTNGLIFWNRITSLCISHFAKVKPTQPDFTVHQFWNIAALERQLTHLRRIARRHFAGRNFFFENELKVFCTARRKPLKWFTANNCRTIFLWKNGRSSKNYSAPVFLRFWRHRKI